MDRRSTRTSVERHTHVRALARDQCQGHRCTCAGVDAVVQTLVPIQYIDFVLEPGSTFEHGGESLAAELETVIAYVYSGSGAVGGTEASSGDTIVLGRNEGGGDGVILESGAEGMSALFLAGKRFGADQPGTDPLS